MRVDGLSHAFARGRQRQVLFDALSFSLGEAGSVALLGRSGCGKSTLLNFIAGLDHPDAGRVFIGELEITGLREPALTQFRRRSLGIIFQFFNLITTLTVAENLRLVLELNGVARREQAARIGALLSRVDLSGSQDRYPEELSGGEQQRVAVVRAVVHHPRLVLADEPTGSLDLDSGQQVIALLRELVVQEGGSLLLVTHSREVARHAERLYVLESGSLQDFREGVVW